MAKTICVVNYKGGCGKTTCCAAVADVMSTRLGKRVLVIDTDGQGNLSRLFGYPASEDVDVALDALLKMEYEHKAGRILQPAEVSRFFLPAKKYERNKPRSYYENLKIICAGRDLGSVYSTYRAEPQMSSLLARKIIQKIKATEEFDYILLDTQPSLSYMLSQFLLGTDYVITPVTPNNSSFDGAMSIAKVFNDVADMKSEFRDDNDIDFLGIFFNMISSRTKAAKKFKEEMPSIWRNNPAFKTEVPRSQDVDNAENIDAPVTAAFPVSAASMAFRRLAREILLKTEGIAEKEGDKHAAS